MAILPPSGSVACERNRKRALPAVPASELGRLPAAYMAAFLSGAAGLVSTADDSLAFARMLLAKGASLGGRILSASAVEQMTTDQLTAARTGARTQTQIAWPCSCPSASRFPQ